MVPPPESSEQEAVLPQNCYVRNFFCAVPGRPIPNLDFFKFLQKNCDFLDFVCLIGFVQTCLNLLEGLKFGIFMWKLFVCSNKKSRLDSSFITACKFILK